MNVLNLMLLTTNTWLKKTSRVTFVIILTSTSYLITFLFNLLFGLFKEKDIVWQAFPDDMDPFILFFMVVWLAPILETWICQYLPFYFLNRVKYLRERNYLILILSALFFGAGHCYSLFYIIYGFLGGIILMYGYMVRVKTDRNIFYLITITHALVNLGGFIVTVALKS